MKKERLALIAIWVTTLIWGFGYIGVEDAIQGGWGTFPLIFARFGIAALVLLPFSFKYKWWKNRKLIFDSFINAIFLFVSYVTQTLGQLNSTISNTSFLTVMWVVFIPIFLFVLTKKKLQLVNYIAVVLAVIGVFILCFGNNLNEFVMNIGDLYTIVAAMFLAIQMIHLEKVVEKHNVIAVSSVQLIFVSLFGFITVCLTNGFHEFGSGGYVGLLYAAVFSSAVAFLLQAFGQKFVSPTKAALIFSLESVVATIAAAFIFQETITWNVIVGGLLMLAASIIVQIKIKPKTQ